MAFEGVHRVGHVGIWVSDIEKSLEWYRDVVGLKLTGIWGEPYRNTGCVSLDVKTGITILSSLR